MRGDGGHHRDVTRARRRIGPKANPTTTTYVPRPEWYFFFLFELLRIIRTPSLVPLATIGVPTICMILLFLLPFYDRSPERRPERRPIATTTAIAVICAMAYLTYTGANVGAPTAIEMATPTAVVQAGGKTLAEYEEGRKVVAQSGCGLPQTRRQRQLRAGARPYAHRLAHPSPGDRAHARQPDRADALVQEPACEEVHRDRQLPLAAQIAPIVPARGGAGAPPGADPEGRTQAGELQAPEVRAMFDRIAGVYDVMNTAMTAGLHHRWRERAVDEARVAPGSRVLDVATGTGDLAFELARRVAPTGVVVGSDFAEGMLARARAKAGGERTAAVRPRFEWGDGRWRCPTPTTPSMRLPWASVLATSQTSGAAWRR